MEHVVEAGKKRNITSTTTFKGRSKLMGVFVSQASSTPTLKVADTSGNIANTFTPLAGTYYPLPCEISVDLVVTISGTVDCTVFFV
jgi:hypothetical protein